MTKSELLKKHDFVESCTIEKGNDGIPAFIPIDGEVQPEDPLIYVWVSIDESKPDEFKILYVGKAGYGLKRRLSQHKGGFVNSATGRKNSEKLLQEINAGRKVFVYQRVSDKENLFGLEEPVSMYSVEENAFYLLFEPEWNRAGFPVIQAEVPPEVNSLRNILADDFIVSSNERGDELDELYNYLNSISKETVSKIIDMIEVVRKISDEVKYHCKLVRGYSEQPNNCSDTPMLVYAPNFKSNGDAINFVARITLSDDLKIVLPERLKSPNINNNLIISKNRAFSPVDTEHFINNWNQYIAKG